jgi:hypothetical protein
MPLLKILPSLISQGSFTGSFSGTGSYARKALTASYVLGGAAGSSGTSGANGTSGSSGSSGANGTSGSSGNSGTSGSSGTSGTSATAGSSGTSGVGSPGTSGSSGSSGSSGASGTAGSSGNSGTSGSSGATGTSGTSGTGSPGSSGSSGTSGATGAPGSSGTSGAGAAGTQGTSGSSGVSGTATLQTGSIAKQTLWTNVTSGSTNTITGLSLSSNKWDVSVVEEWDAATLDQYYNSSSLLCHFDSINPAGRFIDSSRNNFAITSSGNVTVDNNIYKFGGGSAYFDGTGDYLVVPTNSALDFGTGDFTVEGWVLPNSLLSDWFIISSSGTGGLFFGFSSATTVGFGWGRTSVAWDYRVAGSATVGVWQHVAVTRSGTSMRLFVNGVQSGTTQTVSTAYNLGVTSTTIGSQGNLYYFTGYMDELRITKGVARYTANFTPQTSAFPNSKNQVLTKYVGLVGGIDDKYVDYGVQKLSDTSLKLTRLTYPNQPIIGSGSLSGSVNRVYVNVLDYTKVSVTSSYSLLSKTASYALNASGGGGSTLRTGSLYPITASWSRRAITASYALNGGTALVNQTMKYISGSNLYTLSRSVVSPSDVLMSVNGIIQTPTTDYTISASSVTFTESYPSGSKINARYLVTATNSSDVNLANIVLTGTTTGDAYYPQVAALLHFDGVNGSTTITDNSKNVLTVTSVNGTAISTAQSKFGGASCFFDGTNDLLTIPNNSLFDLSSVDFTIEFWFNANTLTPSNGGYGHILGKHNWNGSAGAGWGVWQFNQTIIFFWPTSALNSISTGNVITATNTWYHISVVRSGTATNNTKIYINGVQQAQGTPSSTNSTSVLTIGGTNATYGWDSPYYTAGYIDELRITNGYARYTGNFTPSTTAFSNTGGDVGKALVVNSTATGVSIGTAGYLSSQLAKAWVNFNGAGTVAITDSYNVSSITDDGTGQYRVNFSTPMNNANYVHFISTGGNSDSPGNTFSTNTYNNSYSQTTTYAVVVSRFNGSLYDSGTLHSIVFSN